jgi:hypothetical protein
LTIFIASSPSPFILPLPLVSTLLQNLFCTPVLHSFQCIFTIQRGFTLAFHQWIYYTLIILTPSITLSYPHVYPNQSIAFSVFCYIIFLHNWSVFHIIHFLSFSFFSSSLKQPHYYRHVRYLSIYLSSHHPTIWLCLYLCKCLSFRSIFQIWENMCDFCFPDPV